MLSIMAAGAAGWAGGSTAALLMLFVLLLRRWLFNWGGAVPAPNPAPAAQLTWWAWFIAANSTQYPENRVPHLIGAETGVLRGQVTQD